LWVEPLRLTLEKAIDSLNEWVTGVVKLKVYKGSLMVVGRSSPYSSYRRDVIDYDKGWYPSDEEARGFITMWSMHSLAAARARGLREA
jgi:argininosuccinate synthase